MSGEATKSRVAVVVATHKVYPTLDLCVEGFRPLVSGPSDVIIVDNGSGGAVSTWVGERFPDVTVLPLPENRLYCGGYNTGIQEATRRGCDHVLLVNADVEVVNPRFVDDLVAAMKRWPRAAFLGPTVFYREPGVVQTTCLRFPSLLWSALVWIPFRLAPGLVSRQREAEGPVQFLNGVCVLCRTEALREIGLLDEMMGAYVEDADWAWRARERGWTSIYVPVPGIVHHEEPSGYEPHSFKSFLLKRNTVYWYLKIGKRISARLYASAALALAWARARAAPPGAGRDAREAFHDKLERAFQGMLAGEPPGPWFGEPL